MSICVLIYTHNESNHIDRFEGLNYSPLKIMLGCGAFHQHSVVSQLNSAMLYAGATLLTYVKKEGGGKTSRISLQILSFIHSFIHSFIQTIS